MKREPDDIENHARELIEAAQAVKGQSIKEAECWELLNCRDSDVDKLRALLREFQYQSCTIPCKHCKEWAAGLCHACWWCEDCGCADDCRLAKALR